MTQHEHEHRDPFMPAVPLTTELGRLVTHRVLRPGWQCRLCPNLLTATPTGWLLCLNCDTDAGRTSDA